MQRICKCYKPCISLNYINKELGFNDINNTKDFIIKIGGLFLENNLLSKEKLEIGDDLQINTKDSIVDMSSIFTQDKLLL